MSTKLGYLVLVARAASGEEEKGYFVGSRQQRVHDKDSDMMSSDLMILFYYGGIKKGEVQGIRM